MYSTVEGAREASGRSSFLMIVFLFDAALLLLPPPTNPNLSPHNDDGFNPQCPLEAPSTLTTPSLG